jgi:hypothetical protein
VGTEIAGRAAARSHINCLDERACGRPSFPRFVMAGAETRRGGDETWAMTKTDKPVPFHTPLCPAGHHPHKGEIGWHRGLRLTFGIAERGSQERGGLISPLEGEMSGRTEGGAKGRRMGGIFTNDKLQTRGIPQSPTGRRARWRAPAEPSRVSGGTGVSENKPAKRKTALAPDYLSIMPSRFSGLCSGHHCRLV